MQSVLLNPLLSAQVVEETVEHVKGGRTPTAVYGINEGSRSLLAAALAKRLNGMVYVAYTNNEAMRVYEDLVQLMPERVAYFPANNNTQFGAKAQSREILFSRLKALSQIVSDNVDIIVVPIEALLSPVIPKAVFTENVLNIRPGDIMDIDDLTRKLVSIGYERSDVVESKGQIARRGGIIDIFPSDSLMGVRIEFFDDEIDTIRSFDITSQRSGSGMDTLTIYPATEVIFDDPTKAYLKLKGDIDKLNAKLGKTEYLEETIDEDAADEFDFGDEDELPSLFEMPADISTKSAVRKNTSFIEQNAQWMKDGERFGDIESYIAYAYDELETLFDYLDKFFLLDEPNRMKERCDNVCLEFAEVFTSAIERGDAVPGHEALMRTWDYCSNELMKKKLVMVNQLMVQAPDLPPKAIVKADVNSVIQYLGKIDMLARDIAVYKQSGFSVALLSGGSARAQRLADDLYKYGIEAYVVANPNPITPKTVGILPITLQHSSVWPDIKLAIICENDIFGVTKKKRTARKANTGGKLRAFTDLNPGDYVVHDTHGIGVYVGTVKLDVEGKSRDYIHLRYNGTDKLYIPTDQMDRIQKYIGNTEVAPKLSKLGGGDWEKQKNKVRKSVKELAFDLIKLYAQRQQNPGHKFAADTPWQHEFEDKFPYEETPDQRRSIEEIKLDMERPICMDRLLCGDVGYGKTEVALRAAFKAVMDNKQVAILVPTTILAQQHYQTVMKRFEGFPVKVSVLSRFKTAGEQRQIIKNVNNGDVDIIIGTHKLLNNDIHYKNLGLLIIDEEQRFGVAHKEKIKNLKQHIDVLTLSATPIPRTLHMSMVGIRDMSTLETPPEERYPIQTFVSEYNDSAIRDIILREISRGGQVYFVYNHVQSIDRFAAHLRMLVPEVRIAVGHGQMKESQLEDIMIDFMDAKYDVLLCSTIIETGLDIPAVNTMIIYDADRFGLSQLYQLRGRVGRSNRVAFCYLTVRANKIISETAQKRLSAIKEFTQFGSGFKIAMRDLEIRGAGNILGAQQSGHMASVGYDMYVKLIQEQVGEISGDARIARPEASVNISVDAFLPDDYVKGHSLRMDIYQLIAQVSSANDKDDCIDELLDRFGDMPKACENLVYIAYLKNLCERIGIEQVFMRRRQLVLRFMKNISLDPLSLIDAMKEVNCFTLSATQPPALLFDMGDDNEKGIREAAAKLEQLADLLVPPLAAD